MKTRILLCIVAFTLYSAGFAQAPKTTKARLQQVTVYLQGAHLYYRENVNLQPGNNEFIFENISPLINSASLQASGKGGVVMDVRHALKYRERPQVTLKYDEEIRVLTDSLELMQVDLKNIENKLNVLQMEKNMLLNNALIKGESSIDSLPLLRDGMNFLREKLNNIYDLELRWENARTKNGKVQARLNIRYQELEQLQQGGEIPEQQPVHQVIVSMFSESAGAAVVSFNYFVQQASWVPAYNLQASSSTNTLQLRYFANIKQSSGVEWKNVPLTLSTSNPNDNNIKPELAPWVIAFFDGVRKALSKLKNKIMDDANSPQSSLLEFESNTWKEEFVAMNENLIRTEYELKLNYTVSSDGQPHKVVINERNIPMHLRFSALPKLSADAFLLADITGWEDMNIIPGPARIYFDGSYVGETTLDATSITDTLSVNLGRDKTIVLERKKIREKSKVSFLDNDRIETQTIELTVRNTKNIPIGIVLEDQVPVNGGKEEIKITLVSSGGAEREELSGILQWNLKLDSKETRKIRFTYEVRYPKDQKIEGL